jgi:hypothetical protein
MIYDANAFIGKWPYWPIQSTTPTEVVSSLQEWKIDRAAVCSTRSVFGNWDDGNVEVEAATREQGGELIPFACLGTLELSHALPQHIVRVTDYITRGFKGIRIYPQHHSYHPLYQQFLDALLEEAASLGCPVLLPLRIIMNWGMPMLDIGVIEGLVGRHSRVTWILSGINYLHELQLAISLMLKLPNVYLETSCVMGYAAIEKLVQQCGPQQILFGSGAPLQMGSASLSKVLHAAIPDANREAILGINLCRILKVG